MSGETHPHERSRVDTQRFVSRPSGDGVVILDVKTGRCWELNRVGARVWEMLTTGSTSEAIIASLIQTFPSESHRIPDDVRGLLGDLRAHDILD